MAVFDIPDLAAAATLASTDLVPVTQGSDVPVKADLTALGVYMRTLGGCEALGLLAGVNTQSASYTLVLTDIGKAVEVNNASANTLTVPPNSTAAFAVGSRVDIVQLGAGQTTVTPGAGVTIRQRESKLKIAGQYGAASLYKRGTDEWVLFGDLSA